MGEDQRSCPICWTVFAPTGRQIYCTDRCRKTAYQRRQRHAAGAEAGGVARGATPPAPVDERACPYCSNPITVITLITTPQAARPRPQLLPDPDAWPVSTAPTAATVNSMTTRQIRRERLDMPDAIELAETLAFLRRWTGGSEHELLAQSLDRFIGAGGYHLDDLQSDLARFALLLADIDDDEPVASDEPEPPTGQPDPTTTHTSALRYGSLEM